MRSVLRCAALAAALLVAACRDQPTAPRIGEGEPPSAFAVAIPETVMQGEPFALTVTALDDAGQTDATWDGPVTLAASAGTLSPASATLANGTATVQVTLSGHAGDVTITARSGSVQSNAAAAVVLSGAAAARLDIVPAAALLTGAGATQTFGVRAYDAQGAPTTAPAVTWRSTNTATLTIDAAGIATAQAGVGSGQIIAEAAELESEPAVVLVAQPAGGAVLLADSQIVSGVAPVDPAAPYQPGWQYRVRVRNPAPAVGDLVVGTGATPVGGRVVSTTADGDETDLTLELVPLNQLFIDLRIEESIPMVEVGDGAGQGQTGSARFDAPSYALGAAETEFSVGRFKCTASGTVPSLSVPDPSLQITPNLFLEIGYTNGLERLVVSGDVAADFSYKPVIEATFTGSANCETVLRTFTVPAHGIIALFYGVQVPVGIGFSLDGTLEVAQVGFDMSATATANVELGVDCPGAGACNGVNTFDMTRDGRLEFIAPDPTEQFRVELGGRAFVFARPFLGSVFTDALSFEFIDASAGLKQTVDLAATHRQVEDTAYASAYNLRFLASIGAGKDLQSAIERLGDLLGVDLSAQLTLLEIDDTLATSPRGTFTITPITVAPGDTSALGEMATFNVVLDPVNYVGVYSVDRVEFFWKQDDPAGEGFTLQNGRPSCTQVEADSGQTTFECETDFLEQHLGEQTFYAFVHAELFGVPLPLPLEVAHDGKAAVTVSAACPAPPDALIASIVDDTEISTSNGNGTYQKTLAYNNVSVFARAVSTDTAADWFSVNPDIRITDYIKLMPLNGWPADGTIYLNVRSVGQASATREHAYGANGFCYGDDAEIDASLPLYGDVGAKPPCGELTGSNQVDDTARLVFAEWANDWQQMDGSIYGRARVEGYERSAEVSVNLSVQVVGAEDSSGNPVDVQVCSASGTQY